MIPRALETALKDVARQYPVVTLTGPRQSGKTTLVRETFPGHAYASLEEPDVREYALADPRGFLGQFHEIDLVIDRGRERVAVEIKSAQTVAEDFFAATAAARS